MCGQIFSAVGAQELNPSTMATTAPQSSLCYCDKDRSTGAVFEYYIEHLHLSPVVEAGSHLRLSLQCKCYLEL